MPRARRAAVLPAIVLLLEGCKGCAEEEALPEHLVPVEAVATGVWVADALAVGDVSVPIVTTSPAGAPVAADDAVAVASTGSLASGSVTVDGDGWGAATVTASTAGGFGVDATTTTGTASGSAWSVRAQPGHLDWIGYTPEVAAHLAAVAGGGVVWASASEVWWAPAAGGTPVRVAELGGTVDGILAVQADNDGVTDLVAWSASTVALLRGRDVGGLYHGGAWSPAGNLTITSAAVADTDADALADLAVLTVDGSTGAVSILKSDGVWGYTLHDVLELDFQAYAVSVEDLDNDGDTEVTVLTEDGLLRRYARFEEGWSSTTTGSDLEPGIGLGGRLWPSADVQNDGIPDLIVSGPMLSDDTQLDGMQAWVVTAGASEQVLYKMFDDSGQLPLALGVAVMDLTGDGLVDLALSSDRGFARASWTTWTGDDGSSSTGFLKQTWTGVPQGALGAGDVDGDGVPDVVVGGEHVLVAPGTRATDDTATEEDETDPWSPASTVGLRIASDNAVDPAIGDVTGDGVVDAVLITDTDGSLVLRGYMGVAPTDTSAETIVSGGSYDLGSGEGLDLVVCGTRAWALVEDATSGATRLSAVDLGDAMGPTEALAELFVDGAWLACGAFADGDVAVVSAGGVVTYVDGTSGEAVQGAPIEGVASVAAADEDGDGVDELVACTEAGCAVAAGDLDDDGMDEVATWSPTTGASVRVGGVETALPGAGAPVIADADGDGVADLVWMSSGVAQVHRVFDGAVSPAETRFAWQPAKDDGAFGDLSGDGVPDLFLFGEDPDADDGSDVWTGALLYVEAR
ncbi:MAG: FG-GAP repeat domain-containing protein [Myxococcota bacterium]